MALRERLRQTAGRPVDAMVQHRLFIARVPFRIPCLKTSHQTQAWILGASGKSGFRAAAWLSPSHESGTLRGQSESNSIIREGQSEPLHSVAERELLLGELFQVHTLRDSGCTAKVLLSHF
jgi:hypothetical protein